MEIRRRVFDIGHVGDRPDRSVLLCYGRLKQFFSFTDKDKLVVVVSDKRPRDKNYYEIRSFGDAYITQWRNPGKTRWYTTPYILHETRRMLGLIDLPSNNARYIWLEI